MKRLELHATKSLKNDNINKFCLIDSDKVLICTKFHLPTVLKS